MLTQLRTERERETEMAMVSTPNPDVDEDCNKRSPNSSCDIVNPNPNAAPLVCLVRFAGNFVAAGFVGSIFGYGLGLLKKKGFKGSFAVVGSSAKVFAISCGAHNLVVCFLERLRGRDDVFNAGVAGCCTGMALSFPGGPQALLHSCLSYGAFTFISEGLYKQLPAMSTYPLLTNKASFVSERHRVLLPFTLSLASDLRDGFSSFYKTLTKSNP